MQLACAASSLLLDTGPFMRFSEGGRLMELVDYLDRQCSAQLVDVVDGEIIRLAARRDRKGDPIHPGLGLYSMLGDRPSLVSVRLQNANDVADVQRALRQPGDHPRAHEGEAATIVKAREIGAVIVLDDTDAKKVATRDGISFLSSAQLAAEMVAIRRLTVADALLVYDAATPAELKPGVPFPTERFFRAAIRDAMDAMQRVGVKPPGP